MIELDLTVIAIHGEGDRSTVNTLQAHRNKMEVERLRQYGRPVAQSLIDEPNENPDVLVILRDLTHDFRMEWPVKTWAEVQQWKKIAGWDDDKRHWKHGATVKVRIGG